MVNGGEFRRIVIYVNERETARKACEYPQVLVPEKRESVMGALVYSELNKIHFIFSAKNEFRVFCISVLGRFGMM